MTCRLCLTHSSDYIQIYKESGTESEIAKVITKYLHIVINLDDEVSSKICYSCWKQLEDFNEFCVEIQKKQENLKLQFVESKDNGNLDEHEAELKPLEENENLIFCEPIANAIIKEEENGLLPEDIIFFNETLTKLKVNNLLKSKKETKRKNKTPQDDTSQTVKHTKLRSGLRSCTKHAFELNKTNQKNISTEYENINNTTEKIDDNIENCQQKNRLVNISQTDENDQESEAFAICLNNLKVGGIKKTNIKIKSKYNNQKKQNVENDVPTINNSSDLLNVNANTFQKKSASVNRDIDLYISANTDLSCCLCRQTLEDFKDLKKHFRKEHNCVGYVMCCNNRYLKRNLYVDHLKLHKNPDIFKCLQCNKNLASRQNYVNHMLTVHPEEKDLKYQCQYCSRKFAKAYILKMHIKNHRTTVRSYACDLCSKSFRSDYELKYHQKRVHFNALLIICEICGKNFKCKQNLEQHKISIHQCVPLPEVQCKVCSKWLKDERSLFKHMYKHRDEQSGKQFICNECGVVKTTRQTLSSHILYYHSNKIFKCTLCEKQFKSSVTFKEHMATHTGKDLYTCQFCTQTFKSHANMHNHKKKMHPNEWVRKYSQPSKPIQRKYNEA